MSVRFTAYDIDGRRLLTGGQTAMWALESPWTAAGRVVVPIPLRPDTPPALAACLFENAFRSFDDLMLVGQSS